MPAHKLFFVCEANVCRSPLMAYRFESVLRQGGVVDDLAVVSRGINAKRSAHICEVSRARIAVDAAGAAFADAHRSYRLAPAQLPGQDIVIVASRAERSAIARLNPDMRSRTFTLLEAIELGGRRPEPGEVRAHAVDPLRPLLGYSALLADRRGTLAAGPARRTRLRLPWSAPVATLDIPDAHHLDAARHAKVLAAVDSSTAEFGAQVLDFLRVHAAS